MQKLRDHLIIAFGLIQPEMFIERIEKAVKKYDPDLKKCIPDSSTYSRYALEYFHGLTFEEVENLHSNMLNSIKSRGKVCGSENIFALIPEYTLHVLSMDLSNLLCRQDQKLNWRICYLNLGQDLLTTAHAAYISVTDNRNVSFFGWPAIIGTDDRRLSRLLEKGLAENHFHLNGSTRGFDLSWLCLMNHPKHIIEFFKDDSRDHYTGFRENLNVGVSLGTSDNRLSWKRRVLIACWLRVRLFLWLQTGRFDYYRDKSRPYDSLLKTVNSTSYSSSRSIANIVSEAKYLYGRHGRIEQPGGRLKYLDYAVTADATCDSSCCRVLAGERAFLYKAFRAIYSGKSEEKEMQGFKELFYLYLLIKSQFRREIVQVNGRYGFKNFAKYQDRKDIIFELFPMYALEAYNLSVNDVMNNGNVKSLEMRITPKNKPREMRNSILSTDDKISFLQTGGKPRSIFARKPRSDSERKNRGLDSNYFYVLHFPKLPEKKPLPKHTEKGLSFLNAPRNSSRRQISKTQALALAYSLEKYNWLCTRIRGIDACTFEIPCRPEVFAAEFRFLRDYICADISGTISRRKYFLQPKLSATYHVGEDFMDIIDGLRAIDEAVLFLEMKPNERLGHAIAMGTNVRRYYQLRNNWIVLKKQDILDNIVWALNKSKALNINLGSAFKQKMYDKAAELIYEIYGQDHNICDYYGSWKLRGDDPKLYRFGSFDENQYKKLLFMKTNNITAQFNKRLITDHYHPQRLGSLRKNQKLANLYYMYHFDYTIREKGEECAGFRVTEDYIKMAEDLQAGMRNEIAEKRIAIECNPSSNVLIGPFELYEQHPVFTFFPVIPQSGGVCQFVSVNTDDQGVFDTSLQEEYALLECALKKQKNPDQSPKYSDVEIYDYLERLRGNGFSQTFPKAK